MSSLARSIRLFAAGLLALGMALAGVALTAPALAGPGHDHGHGGHDHDAHGKHAGEADPRRPLLGDWQVDVEATLDTDPELKKAANADGALAAAKEILGRTGLRFTPDGRAAARFPDGRREGVYTVQPQADGLLIRIVDAQDNRLNTADYRARLDGGRLTMVHEGSTLVFTRPGAQAADKPALPAEQAAAIIGKWTVDVPRTLAADTRLNGMTAEQQKAARDAAQGFLSRLVFEWRPDGTASIAVAGRTQKNTWRLVQREGARYTLDVKFEAGGPQAGEHETLILQVDGDFMRMTMGPQILVLARAR